MQMNIVDWAQNNILHVHGKIYCNSAIHGSACFQLSALSFLFLSKIFMTWLQAWLCDVEKAMRWTLKDCLKNCRAALRRMLSKRDKWIKDHAGQVLSTGCSCVMTGKTSNQSGCLYMTSKTKETLAKKNLTCKIKYLQKLICLE